jgi:hypothetical protein
LSRARIADASRDAGVKHLVWSSLPHASKLTNGTLTKLQHFDSKAEVEEYIDSAKGDMTATYYRPASFMDNFKQSINLVPDGVPTYFAPLDPINTKFPVIDVAADTGKFVAGTLEAGRAADGAHVDGVDEWLSPNDIIDTISNVSGSTVKFMPVRPEAYKKFLPRGDCRRDLGEYALDPRLLLLRIRSGDQEAWKRWFHNEGRVAGYMGGSCEKEWTLELVEFSDLIGDRSCGN